jgi:FkbH-like protein
MEKYLRNKIVLTRLPSRGKIQDLSNPSKVESKDLNFYVLRNTAFENISQLISNIIRSFGFESKWNYSPYDDSFQGFSIPLETDFLIVVIDMDRLKLEDKTEFLLEILSQIKSLKTDSMEVLFNVISVQQEKFALPKDEFIDISQLPNFSGSEFFDAERQELFGTPLSGFGMVALGQHLSLTHVLPKLVEPTKLIVVDLDNTLHSGVLGEDGFDGITLNDNYLVLHRQLLDYVENGSLLAIVTKNDPADVSYLLEKVYKWDLEKIFAIEASWEPKSQAITRIIQKANIAPNSVLFIDDNPSEIHEVQSYFEDIELILANMGPEDTLFAIKNFPGLISGRNEVPYIDRTKDLKANEFRAVYEKKDLKSYLEVVDAEILLLGKVDFSIERASEMSRKTNQFNFSLARKDSNEWQMAFNSDDYRTYQCTYKDKFSDSGIILSAMIKIENHDACIEELVISCRVLGRGIEDYLINLIKRDLINIHKINSIVLDFKEGPRNDPARTWVQNHSVPIGVGKEGIARRKLN